MKFLVKKSKRIINVISSRCIVYANYYKAMITMKKNDYILVNYFKGVPNWGDDLNAYLIEKVSGKTVVIYPFSKRKHILGIGSILHFAKKNCIVWGSGFISESSKNSNDLDVRLLRGPLTSKKLNSNCKYFGDPGVCIRKFYYPDTVKKYKYGIIPHHVDKNNPDVLKFSERNDVLLIDIQQDIEPFIDELLLCENIYSSSLHGLIAADSYGIPNSHLVFSNNVLGGRFKFDDYALGVSNALREPIYIKKGDDIAKFDNTLYCNLISNDKINLILSLFPTEHLKN